jgi:hypothetical protein
MFAPPTYRGAGPTFSTLHLRLTLQEVVAQSIQAMGPDTGSGEGTAPSQLTAVPQKGVVPATQPGNFDLFAGQGRGGFGQGSTGSQGESFDPYQTQDKGRSATVF